MDVFKYLKASRELLEANQQSAASIEAERLGYKFSNKNVWIDPRTEKKYKFEDKPIGIDVVANKDIKKNIIFKKIDALKYLKKQFS